MLLKSILVATLFVAASCGPAKEKGGVFYAVKAWGVPDSTTLPNCYKIKMVPVEVEDLHKKCTCSDNADWDLDVFSFSKEDQPSLKRTLITNVIRDEEKAKDALTSVCKCEVFTSEDPAVPVVKPYSINKEQDYFVEYQLIKPVEMLGQIISAADLKKLPIMRVLYSDHLPTDAELKEVSDTVKAYEGVEGGKLICDLVK